MSKLAHSNDETMRRIEIDAALRNGDTDMVAAAFEELEEQRNDLLEALITALPYVEASEGDPCYRPGSVSRVAKSMRAAIILTIGENS